MSAVGIDIAIGTHHECATVDVSTMVAISGLDSVALYGSSKAAVELFAKAWAAEFGPQGRERRQPWTNPDRGARGHEQCP